MALRTYASFAPPLRLSGEPPDSRRGDAVTFNLSRRASCEGAGEPRGSHAASLNEGLGRVHVQKAALPLLGFGVQGMSQGDRGRELRGSGERLGNLHQGAVGADTLQGHGIQRQHCRAVCSAALDADARSEHSKTCSPDERVERAIACLAQPCLAEE